MEANPDVDDLYDELHADDDGPSTSADRPAPRSFACAFPECTETFSCIQNRKRHHQSVHETVYQLNVGDSREKKKFLELVCTQSRLGV